MIKLLKYNDHDEWLAIRRQYIGGSDAGAVMGMNEYKSAYTLWAEKTGKVAEFEGNTTTRVGAYLEDLIAQMFTEETGKKVRKKNQIMVNDEYPWACANVDRMVIGESAVLEIKTTNSFPAMKKIKGGDYPSQWYCQMTHYLAVTGCKKAYLAVLVNCRELHIFELERDEDEIASLMKAEAEFWKLVETNTAPAPDGLQSTTDTIGEIYSQSNGSAVNLLKYDSLLAAYIQLSDKEKAAKKEKDAVANKIKAYMGNASSGESMNYKVSWANQERRTFDVKRFAADHRDINIDSYYNISSFRTFKVNS